MNATRYLLVAALALLAGQIPAQDESGRSGEVEAQKQSRQQFYQTSQIGQYHPSPATARNGQPCRASELIGLDIRNAAGERVGSVEDLIVDLPSGKTSFAVVSTGGVIGIGSKLVAVPINRLSYADGNQDLTMNINKQTLAAAPAFPRNHEPNWNDAAWTAQVERYFHDSDKLVPTGRNENSLGNPVRPAQITTDTSANPPASGNDNLRPDNSSPNVIPSEFEARPTAGSKSASKDILISQQIRRAFSQTGEMASAAMDIQITTRDGQVTLSGSVGTEDQKNQLLNQAALLVGSSRVVDQLEVTDNQNK